MSKKKRPTPVLPESIGALFDSHTHLASTIAKGAQEGQDRRAATAELVARAGQAGVERICTVGDGLAETELALAAAQEFDNVWAACAIHPTHADELDEAAKTSLIEMAANERCVAIGETGLDYFRTTEDGWAGQHESFRRHLDIARRLNLPVQIHDRDAHEDTVRILEEENFDGTVVFHCFSGPVSMAQKAREKGWYVSFGGTATFKNNHELREAIIAAGPQLLMAETDAPFLTAHPFRGRPNAPYMTPYAVRYVAQMFGWDLDEFCHILTENSARVYGDFDAGFTQV